MGATLISLVSYICAALHKNFHTLYGSGQHSASEIYFFGHTAQTRSIEEGLQVFKLKRVQYFAMERVNNSVHLKQEPYSYLYDINIHLFVCVVSSQILPSASSLLQQREKIRLS